MNPDLVVVLSPLEPRTLVVVLASLSLNTEKPKGRALFPWAGAGGGGVWDAVMLVSMSRCWYGGGTLVGVLLLYSLRGELGSLVLLLL